MQCIDDIPHALVHCQANEEVGTALLNCISDYSGLNSMIVINLQMELNPGQELPVVLFLSIAWQSIWTSRLKNQRPSLYKVRADLEARVNLFRETRSYQEDAAKMMLLMEKL